MFICFCLELVILKICCTLRMKCRFRKDCAVGIVCNHGVSFTSKEGAKLEKQLHRALYRGESEMEASRWSCSVMSFWDFITLPHEDQYLLKGLLRGFCSLKSDLWNGDGPPISACLLTFIKYLFQSYSWSCTKICIQDKQIFSCLLSLGFWLFCGNFFYSEQAV